MIYYTPSNFNGPFNRIVSLVPSQTELLFYLGLEDCVIGLTKFCVHPPTLLQTKTIIGGTKDVRLSVIKSLKPDLIIANKEENIKEQVELLSEEFPVFVTDVNDFDAAIQMIKDIGQITNTDNKAVGLVQDIEQNFKAFQFQSNIKAAYLIWRTPYMTIGGETFINAMMNLCGFNNVFANKLRYPEVTIEAIKLMDCQVLLLSTEPYPFKQKHADELQIQLPGVKIILVDGEMFSWYGSRLLHAAEYFKSLRDRLGL